MTYEDFLKELAESRNKHSWRADASLSYKSISAVDLKLDDACGFGMCPVQAVAYDKLGVVECASIAGQKLGLPQNVTGLIMEAADGGYGSYGKGRRTWEEVTKTRTDLLTVLGIT